ncbi:MAG: HEAT repeat domain-containing protein [Planctomycetota bacterium]
MAAIIRFLRQHRWHRRLLTISVTVVAAAIAGLLAYPHVSQWLVLRDLASSDPDVRDRATRRAIEWVKSSDRFLRRLNETLETAGDEKFLAIAEVLKATGNFFTPQRRGIDIDRLRAHEMLTAYETLDHSDAVLKRQEILRQAAVDRRDNVHVRRIVASAAEDEMSRIREGAAVLAAVVGDEGTLSKLLDDGDGRVASAAALCVGITGLEGLYDRIAGLLGGSDLERVSAAAYAVVGLRPKQSSGRICELLAETTDAELRDKLLHVLTILDDEPALRTVLEMLADSRRAEEFPPAMAMLAAARLALTAQQKQQLVGDVRDVLAARRKGTLRAESVLAAVKAAELLRADVLDQLIELCESSRRPYEVKFVWVPVARLMGALALGREGDDPARKRAELLLKGLAGYHDPEVTPSSEFFTMPVASAAAAAALWELRADGAEKAVRDVARAGGRLAVDYLVWHIGLRGRQRAFELASRMLPPPGKSKPNQQELAAGALLTALSAGTDQQRAAAAERIAKLLAREDRPALVDAYNCALLMLTRRELLPKVRQMHRLLQQRRAMTALLVVGDRWALDWLLWGYLGDTEINYILTDERLREVLAETAPQLPGTDAVGQTSVSLWQARIMRYHYVLNRPAIRIGLKR